MPNSLNAQATPSSLLGATSDACRLTTSGAFAIATLTAPQPNIRLVLDEVFGQDNYRNESVWQQTSARSDSKTYNHIHNNIFFGFSAHKDPWITRFWVHFSAQRACPQRKMSPFSLLDKAHSTYYSSFTENLAF